MSFKAAVPRVTAHIELDSLLHNLARVRACAPGARVMAAVKANAYGHGVLPVARALVGAGVDALAVACLEEALALRADGIKIPVVLLEGILSAGEAKTAASEELQVVVHAGWQLDTLREAVPDAPLELWVMLNTGMNRLGFDPQDASRVAHAIGGHGTWHLYGWMTHLACADDPEARQTLDQQACFDAALRGLPGERSVANSAGLLAWPGTGGGWVRPGIMLYGASPLVGRSAAELDLLPVMQLDSLLIAVQEVQAGGQVGYGATWTATRPARVGIVAAGYADGVPRSLPSGTLVTVHGERAATVGRVSMDMCAIDISTVPSAKVGDSVRLWGSGVPAEDMAARVGTIAYELFCGLGPRVHRVYTGQGS